MNLTEYIRNQMRQVTQHLMKGQTKEARSAIQKVLNELPSQPSTPLPPIPTFLNGRMHDKDSANADASLPAVDFVSDLLQRLGVPSPLGENVKEKKDADAQRKTLTPDDVECVKAKGHGQFLTKTFSSHAGTRTYKLYIPSSYQNQPMPLMVMLHGCTQNPDDFAIGTGMNIVAEESQCFVVYPMQSQAANVSKCWNWFKAGDQQRDQGEPSIIAGITRTVIDDYKLDTSKVYVAGLSAGGAMAIIMGTAYPDLYAAVGVHSGLPYAAAHDLSSALAAMNGNAQGAPSHRNRTAGTRLQSIPIIAFHGDKDATVSPHNSEQLMEQNVPKVIADRHNEYDAFKALKPVVIVQEGKVSNGHRYTQTSHHDDNGRSIAEHWLIHGAGHAWAGGDRRGTYTDGKGPDASREMMRFFSTQSLV